MPNKSKKTKILIIEDDSFLIKAYQVKFDKEGLKVIIAKNGAEGLEMAKADAPQLIILDLMLPGMDGFEFLGLIKKDEKLKSIPVVVLSNLGQKSDINKAMALGAVEYLIKTEYTLKDVIKKIKKYL